MGRSAMNGIRLSRTTHETRRWHTMTRWKCAEAQTSLFAATYRSSMMNLFAFFLSKFRIHHSPYSHTREEDDDDDEEKNAYRRVWHLACTSCHNDVISLFTIFIEDKCNACSYTLYTHIPTHTLAHDVAHKIYTCRMRQHNPCRCCERNECSLLSHTVHFGSSLSGTTNIILIIHLHGIHRHGVQRSLRHTSPSTLP